MLIRPVRSAQAFTLLELIVVLVILGVLAAFAIPSFQQVVDKSHDAAAKRTAEAYVREAQALAAFRWDGVFTEDDRVGAMEDLTGEVAAVGVTAARRYKLDLTPSDAPAYGEVNADVSDDAARITAVVRSESGWYVSATGTALGGQPETALSGIPVTGWELNGDVPPSEAVPAEPPAAETVCPSAAAEPAADGSTVAAVVNITLFSTDSAGYTSADFGGGEPYFSLMDDCGHAFTSIFPPAAAAGSTVTFPMWNYQAESAGAPTGVSYEYRFTSNYPITVTGGVGSVTTTGSLGQYVTVLTGTLAPGVFDAESTPLTGSIVMPAPAPDATSATPIDLMIEAYYYPTP